MWYMGTLLVAIIASKHGRSLHRVDCIRILALEGSKMVPQLLAELEEVKLNDARVSIQYSIRKPREGEGCWDAHLRAWENISRSGCRNSLILEDDATFRAGMFRRSTQVDDFIASNLPYDTLQLGMWHSGFGTRAYAVPKPYFLRSADNKKIHSGYTPLNHGNISCIARSVGEPGATHAYVISHKAASTWRPKWNPETFGYTHIDQWMKYEPNGHDNYVVLPSLVYQRNHKSANMQGWLTQHLSLVQTGNTRAHAVLEKKFFALMPDKCWPGLKK